jgi:hypothetical protein
VYVLRYEPRYHLAISTSRVQLEGITELANLLGYDEFILVRNDVMSLGNYLLKFRRITLPLAVFITVYKTQHIKSAI